MARKWNLTQPGIIERVKEFNSYGDTGSIGGNAETPLEDEEGGDE
jgi:hypothetical protein